MIQLFVSIGKNDELADPVGVEWDVLCRDKATGKKEFLKVRQYIVFHEKCLLILKNQIIRNPYSMILRGNYECNENIFPLFTYNYD